VVASNGGADTQPLWYINLMQEPEVSVTRRNETSRRIARTADTSERAELWPELVRLNRMYAAYAKKTEYEISVVILEKT